MEDMIRRVITAEVKESEGRVLEFVGSDETQDRMDEVIRADGWQLKNFKENPVFMWVHDYKQPPIGKAKKVWIDKEAKKLKFNIEFAPAETYEFADTIYKLYKGGFLRAVSVGFIPIEFEEGEGAEEDFGKPTKKPRKVYTKQDLLELSGVPVPANPNALGEARDKKLITAKEMEAVNEWIRKSDIEEDEPLVVCLKCDGEDFEEDNGKMVCTECGLIMGKPYPNEHACRLKDPAEFQEGTMKRTKRQHEGKEYSVIMGKLKDEDTMTEQAYRYGKDIWKASEARSHCKSHDGKFEAASGESMIRQGQLADDMDYLLDSLMHVGMGEDVKKVAIRLANEIIQRLPGDDIPVDITDKIGAVLNKKNRDRLAKIQELAQEVLDSAGKPEEEEENKNLPKEEWTTEDTQEVIKGAFQKITGKLD